MREIPIDYLDDFGIPEAVILCQRGDVWSVEPEGAKAGAFISGALSDSEKLFAGADGQLALSADDGDTAAARIAAISRRLFDVAGNIRALQNVSIGESYEALLASLAKRGQILNLGRLIMNAAIKAETKREEQMRPDRKVVWSHGPMRLKIFADSICANWATEAVSRIMNPSIESDAEIPVGLTDEILDSAYRQTEGDRPQYNDLIHDVAFARHVVSDVFARDLESEAKFFDSSITDDVCSKLDGIDTAGCIVMLRGVSSGLCEYLFSDTESFTRACPSTVGELVCDLASDSCSLGEDVQDIELCIDDGKLCLDEDPDRAHGDRRFEVLFIMKSVSDEVVAMDDTEIARAMAANRMRRNLPAENLVVRLAEKRGDVINVERDICAAFGWEFDGNGRMESLNELMEAVRTESESVRGHDGREKTGF